MSALIESNAVRHYKTDIVVPADRCVVLHLPLDFPEGRAEVTFELEARESDMDVAEGLDPDLLDIEWWEEFTDGQEAGDEEPGSLELRFSVSKA